MRSLLFLYPVCVRASVVFPLGCLLGDQLFVSLNASVRRWTADQCWVILGLILGDDGVLLIWISPLWYVSRA